MNETTRTAGSLSRVWVLGIATVVLSLIAVFAVAWPKKELPVVESPKYSMVFGGDLLLGRRFNLAIHQKHSTARIFGDVGDLLRRADLAVVNAEGVISGGGEFQDKGEPQSHMYRAHPVAIDLLKKAGIDVVSVGNNHSGDYGPAALTEMLDRVEIAGLQATGGGRNLAEARRPAYVQVGDLVVAVVGADLTSTRHMGATADSPGSLHIDASKHAATVAELTQILQDARQYAHLVVFTPHWGPNWRDEPSKARRKLAKALIAAGFDAIVGHSAHQIQGAEIIDGKPVIYDVGNLVLDNEGKGEAHKALVWELKFDKAGVSAAIGHPIRIGQNRVRVASKADRSAILATVVKRSEELGTRVTRRKKKAWLDCQPGPPAAAPTQPPPKIDPPTSVRDAPREPQLDELPAGVHAASVEYESGIRLVGYHLLLDEIPPKGGQFVTLYLQADRPLDQDYWIHLEARGPEGELVTRMPHLPGDWMMGKEDWPIGPIVVDRTLMILKKKPESVTFLVSLWANGVVVAPIDSDLPIASGDLVELGTVPVVEDAPSMFSQLEAHRARRP